MIPGVPGGDFYAPRGPRGPRGPGANFEAVRGVNFPFSYRPYEVQLVARWPPRRPGPTGGALQLQQQLFPRGPDPI